MLTHHCEFHLKNYDSSTFHDQISVSLSSFKNGIIPPFTHIQIHTLTKKRAYREEGYLSTAERTSLLSIFPPSPDARSNAPAFDIFLSLSKQWLTRILGDLKQSKKNVEISRSIIINQTKNRCIQFKEIPERKKKLKTPE